MTISAIITEWNTFFFIPRGLRVVPIFVPPSKGSTAQAIDLTDASFPPKEVPDPKASKEAGMALHEIVSTAEIPKVQLLLDRVVDVNVKPIGTEPSLVKAVTRGNEDIVRMLLEHGADLEACSTGHGTALYQATISRDKALVRLLLQYGANIEAKPYGTKTALGKALETNDLEMAPPSGKRGRR